MTFKTFTSPGRSVDHVSAVERILSANDASAGLSAFDLADALGEYVASARFVTKSSAIAWLADILRWTKFTHRDADAVSTVVLEGLIALGVYGVGVSFGQKVLIHLPERTVLVPGVGRLRVGGLWQPSTEPAFHGSILAKSFSDENALSLAEAVGGPEMASAWLDEVEQLVTKVRQGVELASLVDAWQQRLVMLTCSLDTGSLTWKIAAPQATAVLEWAGITPVVGTEESADADQEHVVRLPSVARVIVSAGPGSGKTQVVCRRIAHLLAEGTQGSRIWLLSFTRVAVEELRKRIGEASSSAAEVHSLHVATFDSFAWKILDAGLPAGAVRPSGYDAAVDAAHSMLEQPPQNLQSSFAGLKHVVIDEAQDLLGPRLSMMRRFIELLPASCGVTILGDEAQSIYRWSNRHGDRQPGLLEQFPGFDRLELRTDHRTKNVGLAVFFREAREFILADEVKSDELYLGLRGRIEDAAVSGVRGLSDPAIPVGRGTMFLFRGRRALLAESQLLMTRNRGFRLRPSGHGQLVRPWIGALLAGIPIDTPISFEDLAEKFISAAHLLTSHHGPVSAQPAAMPSNAVMAEAWETLLNLADISGNRLNLSLLHRRLTRGGLPPDLLRQYLGNTGPLLSTIHGAKGLEAENVVLMLPRMPEADLAREGGGSDNELDLREEARVLYVGATRAKSRLFAGSQRSGKFRPWDNHRSWRGYSGDFSMEVGIEGDALPLISEGDDLVEATRSLALPGESPKAVAGLALRDARTGQYRIFRADRTGAAGGPALGLLSPSLINVFAKTAQARPSKLPEQIGGFFISGASTCAWETENGENRGIALVPVLCGLASISMET